MTKLQFSIVVLLILACVVQAQRRNRTQSDHIAEIKPHRKGDIPPNIRKCLNVKCAEGERCFHGGCIKVDNKCLNIKCDKGFRCKQGQCLKQLCQPKKAICGAIGSQLTKKTCDQDLFKKCNQQVIQQNVCGFNKKNRKYFDYPNPCQACSDKACDIDFYYETTCDAAPRICKEDEECLNGVCTDMFNDEAFINYRACNNNVDCKVGQYCISHKCIFAKHFFNFIDSKSQETSIFVKI